MENCCQTEPDRDCCPECSRAGRSIGRITLKALLRPGVLEHVLPGEHRFCATASCDVVYFGAGDVFRREDVAVQVFQKQPEGGRTVCYCLEISEDAVRREVEATGRSTSSARIKALVKAERCACEVRNPQGTCCLGNVTAILKSAAEAVETESGPNLLGQTLAKD